jgi:hypothetical protein
MPPFRSHALSLTLGACAAIGALACAAPEVHPAGGAPAGNVPRGGDVGVKLPDAGQNGGAGGQNGSPTGFGDGSAGTGDASPARLVTGGEACAMDVHQADRVPVDLLLLLDASLSMGQPVDRGIGRSKYDLVSEALTSFIKDPRSAGMGVGLQFFPVADAPAPKECSPSTYEKPAVPIGALPGAEVPVVQALQDVDFGGATPMGPAVAGALNQARRQQATNPTHRVAVVLATDGVPHGGLRPIGRGGLFSPGRPRVDGDAAHNDLCHRCLHPHGDGAGERAARERGHRWRDR